MLTGGNHFHLGIVIDDVVIAFRADASIGIGLLADQFDEIALLSHEADEFLGSQLSALIIVGNDLRDGDAGGVNLTVDEE